MLCFLNLCFVVIATNTAASPIGIKVGVAASAFNYTDRVMVPYIDYDIDLRPYLGYDIEWVQLGEQKPLLSPFVSCFFHYKFADKFFVRPEVGVMQKGVVFNQYDYERIIYEVKISYLQFPLTLGYQVVNKDYFIVELYAGGAGAFKLNALKKVGYHNSQIHHIKLNNICNFDFSWLFGFNIKWKLFEKYFLFDVQSFIGLTDIFYPIENQIQLYQRTQKTKNAGLVISLGYEFTR
ncbi:MAG: PorT family protein [Tissierellales bacterium]|nr:PorT family protein [Tissierellales bacterium]